MKPVLFSSGSVLSSGSSGVRLLAFAGLWLTSSSAFAWSEPLLSQRQEIDEVILYEAADWLYFLPLADADLCGHGFIDRCGQE